MRVIERVTLQQVETMGSDSARGRDPLYCTFGSSRPDVARWGRHSSNGHGCHLSIFSARRARRGVAELKGTDTRARSGA